MIRRHALVVLAATAGLSLASACGAGGSPVGAAASPPREGDPGISSPPGGAGLDVLRVGVVPVVDVAPLYLGVERGFFAEEGIELRLESGQGGAAIVPGVVSGQLDAGFSNVTSLLLATARGLSVAVLAPGAASTGEIGADFGAVVVPEGSEVRDAAGLSGRRVAVNTLGNIGDTTIRQAVREAGGDPDEVGFVELPFPDMPAALAAGRVDAAWVVEPFLTITRSQGARPVSWNFAATDPDLTVAVYFTSGDLAATDPGLVERFAAAVTRSLAYAEAHPDEARGVLSSYTEIDAGTAEALTLPRWPTAVDDESVELLAELAMADGLLDEQPDLDALLP